MYDSRNEGRNSEAKKKAGTEGTEMMSLGKNTTTQMVHGFFHVSSYYDVHTSVDKLQTEGEFTNRILEHRVFACLPSLFEVSYLILWHFYLSTYYVSTVNV